MTKFLKALWRVITFPVVLLFNIIVFPFRALRRSWQFLNEEPPEDPPLIDTFSSLATEAESRQSLGEHLSVLRVNILRTVVAFIVCCIFSFTYVSDILVFLQIPLKQLTDLGLRISSPGNIFDIIPKVTFATALILAMPYILFELYLWAAPGLSSLQRKLGLVLIPIFSMLSIASLAIAYYLFLPFLLSTAITMTSQFGIYDWELSGYLSFVGKIMGLSAVIVYYPFVIYIYSVAYDKPRIPLRLIVLISFCLAAALTPGTMVLIDFGLTIVLSLIYIPTYLAIALLYKRSKEAENQKPA